MNNKSTPGSESNNSDKILADSAKRADIRPRFDRRPSVDIAKSFVELNIKAVIDADNETKMSDAERQRQARAEKKQQRRDRRRRHRARNIILSLLSVVVIAIASCAWWWSAASEPVNLADKNQYQFTVSDGSSIDQIANSLQRAKFIRNSLAFRIYASLNGLTIHAGTFNVSPSDNLTMVASKLSSNQTATITVLIPPGMTLKQLSSGTFHRAGFGKTDIATALKAHYDNSILDGRPANASLEGYLFPDTYSIGINDNLRILIAQSLNQLAKVAQKDDLRAGFAKQNLNFYQGLTLASIVTEEVDHPADQKMVAGVFYNRLKQGMPLQSDTTYKYAYAQGLCSSNDTSCDSIYNTYNNAGLPPGPIANPSASALDAVAHPTDNNYTYFFADSNGNNHYETTLAQQQADIAQYGLAGN